MKITVFDKTTPLSFDAPSPRNPREYPHIPWSTFLQLIVLVHVYYFSRNYLWKSNSLETAHTKT